jgi:translation initiation factor IF-2
VLVYVTIVALEAFYVNDTSEIQTMADYGGQDTSARSLRTEQANRIGEYGSNPKPAAPKANEAPKPQTYRIPIDVAMKLVVEGAKADPSSLIPQVGRSDKGTVLPIFGRPKLIPPPAAPAVPAPADAAPAGAAPAGAAPGATPGASTGSGSGAATELPAAPKVPTGAGPGSAAPSVPKTDKPGSAAAAPKAGSAAAAPKAGSAAAAPKAGSAAAAPPKGNGK